MFRYPVGMPTETSPTDQFGKLVRRRREALEMTIEELAERAELTPRYLNELENGQRDPSLSTVFSIAEALGVEASDLFSPELH